MHFCNLIELPAQTSCATPHSHKTWRPDLGAFLQSSQINTILNDLKKKKKISARFGLKAYYDAVQRIQI